MGRRSAGTVVCDRRRQKPVYGLRFRAEGQRRYLTLGTEDEGWNLVKAEVELQNIMADVRRGRWRPQVEEDVQAPRDVPTFHEFASRWLEQRKLEGGRHGQGLADKSREDLEWRLTHHLLPAVADFRLDQITAELVDSYRLAKVRGGRLGPTSINKTLTTLSAILEQAVEYEVISRNPARGRRRRLPAAPPARSWIDRAEHIEALLDGAGQLDRRARVRRGQRRALLATLVFAGLRIGETLALTWRDVDLARGTITVRAAKTDAGVRTVNIVPVLRDELASYRARLDPDPTALVFTTGRGTRQGATNVRRRVLANAVAIANARLAETAADPLPARLTPHSLRRTFASLLFAIGETPPYVMAQLGHTTPGLTLAIYARQMDRRDGEPERLKALVEGRACPVVPAASTSLVDGLAAR